MEAFLRNVPQDLSDTSLRKELAPFMNALDIKDWDCEKPRKRPFAFIRFLNEKDGNKFLSSHERKVRQAPIFGNAQTRSKDTPRLYILKAPIYVVKSDRPMDKHKLSHLQHEAEARARPRTRNRQAPAVSCPVHRIACGHNMFVNSALTFVRECVAPVSGTAKFGRRSLILNFTPTYENLNTATNESLEFLMEAILNLTPDERLEFSYETVEEVIVNDRQQMLTLILNESPKIHVRKSDELNDYIIWNRATRLGVWGTQYPLMAYCLVYQISVSGADFANAINRLKSHESVSISSHDLPLEMHPVRIEQEYTTSMDSFKGALEKFGSSSLLPFSLVFQVQALVWNNYLHPASGRRLLDIMASVATQCKNTSSQLPFTTDSMKQLFQRIQYPCVGTLPADFDVERLLKGVIEAEQELRAGDPLRVTEYGLKLPSHQAWVLKATVTPTRILLNGPDAESKNKILRRFEGFSNYFLRVTFSDENGEDLSFNPKISNESVFQRYRQVLHGGIKIAGRHFSFLGFSHSSLRSHSAWFQAPFTDSDMQRQDYTTIIRSLGKFEDIRVPAKCAARIGQAFSETPFAVKIFDNDIQVRYIPDVKSPDESRIFSDGVGTVSADAMEILWGHLPMSRQAPTCFQIRWAGFKGMVALDTRLKGKTICFRKESMMKFDSNDLMELGICDTSSKPLRLVLNQQMIKILEDMGTSEAWFLKQQKIALDVLRQVTTSAVDTAKFLDNQSVGLGMGLSKLIRQLDKMEIDYRRDNFFSSVVEHTVMRELRLLKYKARIPVAKGVTLFGIMDETEFLEEGEVYITYEQRRGDVGVQIDRSLSDGPLLVTRSPALHPGDIQIANMKTPPVGHPLRDLQNCIVFSQKGSRDLPSMLSGGDLDGDLYNIIWDSEATPKRTYRPADYPRVLPQPLGREVTPDDMADFFIMFMQTDKLGMIATRHQILADYKPDGTVDPDCVKLAEMHSTAVDFSKTGIPADPTKMPKAPPGRPDFLAPAPPLKLYDLGQIAHIEDADSDNDDDDDGMGRAKHKFYKSEKTLGKLFRSVDEKKVWDQNIKRKAFSRALPVWEQLSGQTQERVSISGLDIDYNRQLDEAWKIRDLYESAISDIMWQFSENPRKPITEVEAFCGSILSKTGSQTRRQRDSSIKLKDEMDRILTWIVRLIRDRSTNDDASSVAGADLRSVEDAVELAWACMVVAGVDNTGAAADHGTGKLRSFRVVAASCLVRELDHLAVKKESAGGGRGGGYVGVSGGAYADIYAPATVGEAQGGGGQKVLAMR